MGTITRISLEEVSMEKSDILEQMRVDWDARALENAKFYINCRRRDQDDAEFDGSALDIQARVRRDYAFLPFAESRERRFLEIGCGIGRLMRPLSVDCGEIHGVDISAEMVRAGSSRRTVWCVQLMSNPRSRHA